MAPTPPVKSALPQLGAFVLTLGMKKKDTSRQDALQEQEANYFALCLLVPKGLLVSEIERAGGLSVSDGGELARLARMFQVSENLILYALCRYGLARY